MTRFRRVAALLSAAVISLALAPTAPVQAATPTAVFVPISVPARQGHTVAVPAHTGVDLGTGLALPATAQMVSCPAGAICFYDYWCTCSVNYELWQGSFVSTTCSNLGTSMRDRTSYIWNNSGYRFEVYIDGPGCLGASGTIWAHSDGNMGFPYNNNIDALRRVCFC